VDRVRKMSGGAEGVVSATGDAKQSNQQDKRTAHAVVIVAPGTFTPIQVASILALEGPQECVQEICETYRKRRDVLVKGLNQLNWQVSMPKATMFVWASIPERYKALGSLEFSKKLLTEAKVAVSPGVGFGEHGDEHVRFSLIENEERTRQALRGIKQMFLQENL